MSLQRELAALYRRDLVRLRAQIADFPEDGALWRVPSGATNPPGNLALHLEGNLREYIGRQIGGVPYARDRAREFALRDLRVADVAARVTALAEFIPRVIAGLPDAQLDAQHPELVLDVPTSTRQLLLHLYAHMSWHLGQIDYARRMLTDRGALPAAGLGEQEE